MSSYKFSIPSPSIKNIENDQLVFSLNDKLYKDLEHQINNLVNSTTGVYCVIADGNYASDVSSQSLCSNNNILSNSDGTDQSTDDNILCYNENNQSDNEVHDEPQNIGIEEIIYEQVIWDSIKAGVYLLVDFIGGLRKKHITKMYVWFNQWIKTTVI